MSGRSEWFGVVVVLASLVLLRAWTLLWFPGAHFDSDQAIVGLMAKHVSEGVAFPLYYYGQTYMLAVEAWLAAPVMWVLGPSVTAVKLPLLAVNLLAVWCFVRIVTMEVGLRPSLAAVAALPLAMPGAVVAARTMEANGGNVEPWLYVLVLWMLRRRPWAFGLLIGVASAHREFVLYGAGAALVIDVAQRAGRPHQRIDLGRHWVVASIAALAARALLASLEPFASALGPGTRGNDLMLGTTIVDPVAARMCFAPEQWWSRAGSLATDHLPRLFGGLPRPLREYGVLTSVPAGFTGVWPLAAVLTIAGLTAASGAFARGKARARHDGSFGLYLSLVGLISTLVYGFGVCIPIHADTLRYNLLGILMPAGALVLAFSAPAVFWRSVAVRSAFVAVTLLWTVLNASDSIALAREYASAPPIDQRQALAAELERRAITSAWSEYRFAYHVTFLARERVRVSANDYTRIRAYFDEALAGRAPTITTRACPGGEELVPRVYLCGS